MLQLSYFLANLASDTGPMPFPHSSALEPWYPPATRLGFDNIYLVNLKRRPERLAKMQAVFRFMGIEFELFEAVDGERLPMSELAKLKFIPEYQDPFYKRPMKKGEIGCFLSHHRIWEDVLKKQYGRVLVFEDDVRFVQDGLAVLEETVEDIMKTRMDWDFIYLGRKKMSPHGDEFFVKSMPLFSWDPLEIKFRSSSSEHGRILLLDAGLRTEPERCAKASGREAARQTDRARRIPPDHVRQAPK